MQKNISRRTKKWIILSYTSIILFVFFAFISFGYLKNFYNDIFAFTPKEENVEEESLICDDCVRRNIDGVYVPKEEADLRPIAVMIDNHYNARPSRGLAKANLVYESEVEGSITRLLAIYATNEDIPEIGPIRSARPYFLDWSEELSSIYVHCGGSPEALVKIVKEDVVNINEFYNANIFWRDKKISAPHNIFTSLSKLKENRVYKEDDSSYFSWKYKEEKKDPEIKNSEISILFKEPYYAVSWKYDILKNNYIRYVDNDTHKDYNGDEIRAKNIILHFVDSRVIDDKLRLKIETIGKNKAVVCLDGECIEGEWRKDSISSRTRYYNEQKEEIEFNPGITWVEVVKNESMVDY
jgi:hypothetical protein